MKQILFTLLFFQTLFAIPNEALLKPQSNIVDFTFNTLEASPQSYETEQSVEMIEWDVEKILGHIPRTFKTNTCGTDPYGNNYCNEALSECAQEWDYEDGYSSSGVGSVVDYADKVMTTTKEVCSTNTGVRMYSNCYSYAMNYSLASSYCSNLVEGGYNDWRLPTIYETATSSGMGGNGVPSCSDWTWTSTDGSDSYYYDRYVWSGSSVYNGHIDGSGFYYYYYPYKGRVRCVR